MKIKYFRLEEKKIYNNFLGNHSIDGGFLQSWEWGEMKKKEGYEVIRIGVLDNNNIILATASLLVLPYAKIFKKYYIARGPILSREILDDHAQGGHGKNKIKLVLEVLFAEIENQSKIHKPVFLRVEPDWSKFVVDSNILSELQFIKGKRYIQACHSMVIDLTQTLEDLSARMKQKTRYNIRLAERKGVEINVFKAENKIKDFLKALKKTATRNNFVTLSDAHYKVLANHDSEDFKTKVVVASYNGIEIATALILQFKTTGYYLMGASDRNYRNVMAPYLLHWEIIKHLKEEGCVAYDLWGVKSKQNNDDKRELNWQGFSDFKQGFAPYEEIIEYYGVWEKPYRNKLYKILNMLK